MFYYTPLVLFHPSIVTAHSLQWALFLPWVHGSLFRKLAKLICKEPLLDVFVCMLTGYKCFYLAQQLKVLSVLSRPECGSYSVLAPMSGGSQPPVSLAPEDSTGICPHLYWCVRVCMCAHAHTHTDKYNENKIFWVRKDTRTTLCSLENLLKGENKWFHETCLSSAHSILLQKMSQSVWDKVYSQVLSFPYRF